MIRESGRDCWGCLAADWLVGAGFGVEAVCLLKALSMLCCPATAGFARELEADFLECFVTVILVARCGCVIIGTLSCFGVGANISGSIEDILLDWADYSELLLHQIENEFF